MKERCCAAQSSAYRKLKACYDNRLQSLQDMKRNGRRVVGTLGADVPDEVLLAAGLAPYRVPAMAYDALPYADRYLEYSFDPQSRSLLETLLNGNVNGLDFIAISNSGDVLVKLYYYLREIERTEQLTALPPVGFVDLSFTRYLISQQRNIRVLRSFIETVEKWNGTTVDALTLHSACTITNKNRAALRRMAELRREPHCRLTGSEALVAIGAGFFMDKLQHTAALDQFVRDAMEWPRAEGLRCL